MAKVEILTRASALHEKRALDAMKRTLIEALRQAAPFEIEEVTKPSGDHLAAVLVLTGGVEREVLKLVAQLPPPSILIAHSGHNSLPASLEILARIRKDGGEGRILYGEPEEVVQELQLEMAVSNAWNALRFSRVGLIGDPSEWLIASDVDPAYLKGRLAIDLIDIKITDFEKRIAAATVDKSDIQEFTKKAKSIVGPNSEDIKDAIAVYKGLRALVDEHRLAACSVRCFDLVTDLRTTGCYALARLNDEGIPTGCEGDVQTLFSLYIGSLLTQKVAFMGNVTAVDTANKVLGLAHCMCPLSMAMQYTIYAHFESGLGIGISGEFPTGPCTVFRLGGERLDQLFVTQGTLENPDFRNDLCRTQLRILTEDPIDGLLSAPLGNHHTLIPGHHKSAIERFFERYLRP